jgi:hypothetical protein
MRATVEIANEDIRIDGDKVFFGSHQVEDLKHEPGAKLPSLYVVRVYCENRKYQTFVTGLDLTSDGYFWLGGIEIDSYRRQILPPTYHKNFSGIESILDKLCHETQGKNWKIFLEDEPLEIGDLYGDDF